ncbi:MAG TPA: PAS domain S-box protein [Methanomassiliicoccales archaeon]|jgi:PAS domain S-box-containing protein
MPRVVYVDDEPRLLEITKTFLEQDDEIHVDIEELPHRALAAIASGTYDVIVSDYQMPTMDGIELLKTLRAKGDRTPFILFTGRGREEVAIEAINNGADFYLQKGGDPQVQFRELKNAIIQLAQRRRAEGLVAQGERKYRDLVEGANSIILKLDPAGNIVFMNTFGMQFFDAGHETIGKPVIGTLVLPQDYPDLGLAEQFQKFLTSGKHSDSYTFPARSGGKEAWVSWTLREVRDTYDRVTELLAIGNDVTALKRTEMKLQHSTAVLRATLDSSDEGILVITDDGVISEHNLRFLDMWRIPSSIMETGSAQRVIDYAKNQLKDPDRFARYVEDCRNNPDQDGVIILEFQDGRVAEVYSTPERIGNEIVGWFFSFKDITRQKEFESRLMLQRENMRSLFVSNPANMLLIEPDTDLIVHANKAACRFYGYDEGTMSRMKLSDISILPLEEYWNRIRSAKNNEKNYFFAPHRLENGEVRDVEIFLAPISYKGRVLLFGIVQDISNTKSTRRLIKETKLKQNRILDCLSEGIIAVDAENRIVFANERSSEVLGLPLDKLVGVDPDVFLCDESKISPFANPAKRRRGDRAHLDYRLKRSDGSKFWAAVSVNPLFTDEVYEGSIFTLRDITERKEAEMEVRKVRHKLELLGDITRHDIQNQVTTIMGNVELGRRPGADPTERLDRIEQAAVIIGSHIEFAKDYQELGTTAPTWQGVADTVEGLGIAKNVASLEISGRARGLQVSADPMLKKVFHNLLEDSVKYAGKPPRVTIDCHAAGDCLMIAYQDNGPGVPPAEKESIFEKGHGHGTGLGLFLSREVLAITGITIKETGRPGEGARFEMLIPPGQFRFL